MGEGRIDMKRYSWIFGALLVLTSCTGDFKDINTDLSGITDEDLQIDYNEHGIRLGVIQQGIYFNYDYGKGKNWPFQLIQNLNADMFSGYMHDGKPLNGGTHNSDYNMQDGWNSAMWTHMYSYIFPQIYQSENATRDTEPALFGITKVLKVEVMHRVTDYYGPVIYKNFANAQNQYRPDTQKEVYYEFFNELDSAVVSLADYIEKKPESNGFTRFDILLDGQYSSWIKFANSLRMRLAMRISAVDPDKARTEFRKGLENEFGVFEAEAERVAVSTKSGFTNPLGELNRVWNETYMSAAMESILTGYDDPRLKVYFETCTDKAYAGEYRGIRQGTCFAHNHYAGLSKLSVDQSTDAPLMSSAEVWFLRAEAALRGFSNETPKTCYETGIKTSFAQWGVGDATNYLASDKKPSDYKEMVPASGGKDMKALITISPKWNDTAGKEGQLEQIITQKWLACWPESYEAWSEQRRTGYPKLFKVQTNNSGGTIDTNDMIRRLPFSTDDADKDPVQYDLLKKALGGPDHGGTRLWWDAGKNNF